MKKFTFLVCAILAGLLKVNAQEAKFVSTEQQNRNVLIEEFTGRECGYCPLGQKSVNQMMATNPGRVFSVNIHRLGFMSTAAAPNLNTTNGGELFDTFGVSGIPAAAINRSGATVHPADPTAATIVDAQLKQEAEVNIAGQVLINPETRVATITVEAYYTADSKKEQNYLNIMMLQDSILGTQNGGDYFNPEQMIGNLYVHMHTFRDLITDMKGDVISPTTAGTLVTKTYTYEIPEVIGDPNGVEVDLDNIHFIAFVTQQEQGKKSVPILNVCDLPSAKVFDKEIYPYFNKINIQNNVSCSAVKPATIELVNGGTQEITSLKYEVEVWGVKTQYSWEGSLPSHATITFEEDLTIYVGEHNVKFRITEVNGKAHYYKKELHMVSEGWVDAYFYGEENEFIIDIAQDKYGKQITWEIIDSNDEVLASGGPYPTLVTNTIKNQRAKVKVGNNECIKFIIRDEGGDGINSGFGAGYYKISDAKGHVLVESDGKFGFEAHHNISTKEGYAAVEEMTNETYKVYPNPVKDILTIEGENVEQVNVYNTMGQLVKTVKCNDNTVNVNVNDLQSGMYIVNVIDNNGEVSTSKVSVLH